MTIHHSPIKSTNDGTMISNNNDSKFRGLPPKSPASMALRQSSSTSGSMGLTTSSSSSSRKHHRTSGRGRNRSNSPESRTHQTTSSSPSSSAGSTLVSSLTLRQSSDPLSPPPLYQQQQQQQSQGHHRPPVRSILVDPSHEHMKISGNADDFFFTPDLSSVTFESVFDRPLGNTDFNMAISSVGGGGAPTNPQHHPPPPHHRRSNSWDSSEGYEGANRNSIPPFRKHKVMSADVASVGNASDTTVVIMIGEFDGRISGRDLHEKAKRVLNAGQYEDAILMFEAIQKAQVGRFGEAHPSVGAAMHNVAVVRLRMGQAAMAERLFEDAVAIRRTVLGDDHLDLAASLAKLGSARVAMQKFDDGLIVLREALQITQKALGHSNKTVAQILCHIACLYFEASELFSAQATFEDALTIYRSLFQNGTDREDACMAQMTDTLCNIGSIQIKRKNFLSAIDYFREALDLQRSIMGHDHPRVIATLDNLGYSFSKAKMYNQALGCYQEMMSAQLSRYQGFTTESCGTLKKLIILYEKTKDVNGAIKAAKDAMDRLLSHTPIPESSVMNEIEQILTDLKQKRKIKRRNSP